MADERTPSISVIIPVRDRRELLSACLDALECQTADDFEVVVVDDGSRDGSADIAKRRIAGREVRVIRRSGQGAVPARRVGVESARSSLLAFTDSDCRPRAEWIERGVAALQRGAALANGPTVPARPVGPLERSPASGTEGLYQTSNLFMRRAAYEEAGGFDVAAADRLAFRWGHKAKALGFGEDTLLAWRIRRTEHAVYVPDAVVEHHVFPADLRETVSRTWMAAAFPALVREVPELRGTLLRQGVMLGSSRRAPLYAAVAAAAGGHRRVARLAFAAWAGLHARDAVRSGGAPVTSRAIALPVVMALDVLTAAALVVGSARARSLTL